MNEGEVITAHEVPDSKRKMFLPRYFDRHFIKGESLIYYMAGRLSVDYRGGSWKFMELNNGGFYVVPLSGPLSVNVQWDLNGFDGAMSADAFGIVVTLFVLCLLCEQVTTDAMIDRYHYLRDYAATHPKARKIFQAID